jgi:DNA-binding beta-propeller fold protein YncE
MPSHNKIVLICLLLLFTAASAGCTGTQQRLRESAMTAPVWPGDGEMPRIRYLSSFTQPEDLQIRQGMVSRIWDYVVGAPARGLVAPQGVTTDADGTIYVVDAALKTVQIYNISRNKFSMVPDDDHLFETPIHAVADEEAGRLYVTDAGAGAVRSFALPETGSAEEFGKGQLERPTGIALNKKTNELLVLDTRQAAVFRYNRQNLALVGRFGVRGTGYGEFNYPTDLTVNSNGEILVNDSLNFRIQVFSPTGEFRHSFGKAGDSPGYFNRPKGVAVDSDNNIYVVDTLFDNVQIFDAGGHLLLSFGQAGQGAGEFWMPTGIFIDKNDRIYVADTYNKRVQTFQYLKQAGHK